MSLAWPPCSSRAARRVGHLLGSLSITALLISCGSTTPPVLVTPDVGSIQVSPTAAQVEKGYHQQLSATVRNKLGTVVTIPVVWRSLNEAIATVDANGRVFAIDTGVAGIYASSLGVNSGTTGIRVVFQGAAKIATSQFTAPAAVSAGATPDSLRVLVTDRLGNPVTSPARVAFAVTAGGGTISPAIAVTRPNGIASAEWKLGSTFGLNTVTATVLCEDDKPCSFASPNSTTFSITTFPAISPVAGDSQTAVILSALP